MWRQLRAQQNDSSVCWRLNQRYCILGASHTHALGRTIDNRSMGEDFDEMASWLLDCKNCNEAFTYSFVPETLFPSRPPFPPEGQERDCPYCKNKSTYEQIDLRFQNG